MFTVCECRGLPQRTNNVKVKRGHTDARKLHVGLQDYPMERPCAPLARRQVQRTFVWAVVTVPLAPSWADLERPAFVGPVLVTPRSVSRARGL
jgi:hypothetical protein